MGEGAGERAKESGGEGEEGLMGLVCDRRGRGYMVRDVIIDDEPHG